MTITLRDICHAIERHPPVVKAQPSVPGEATPYELRQDFTATFPPFLGFDGGKDPHSFARQIWQELGHPGQDFLYHAPSNILRSMLRTLYATGSAMAQTAWDPNDRPRTLVKDWFCSLAKSFLAKRNYPASFHFAPLWWTGPLVALLKGATKVHDVMTDLRFVSERDSLRLGFGNPRAGNVEIDHPGKDLGLWSGSGDYLAHFKQLRRLRLDKSTPIVLIEAAARSTGSQEDIDIFNRCDLPPLRSQREHDFYVLANGTATTRPLSQGAKHLLKQIDGILDIHYCGVHRLAFREPESLCYLEKLEIGLSPADGKILFVSTQCALFGAGEDGDLEKTLLGHWTKAQL